VKGNFAAKRSSLRFGQEPQGLFRWQMFLVEGMPKTPDMAWLDPQPTADLFQGSGVVDVVHVC